MVVTVSEPRKDALNKAGLAIPPSQTIKALVDTGASCTCIDPTVLEPLNLAPTGTVSAHTPSTGSTPAVMNQFDVGMVIYGATADHPPFHLPTVAVMETPLRGQGFDALLGRDILSNCLLVYNGTLGRFTLAF